jgi:site-specific recombinase XerD
VSIDVQDLRLNTGSPFLNIIGKGRKERQVFLNDACLDAIETYLTVRDSYAPEKGHEDALFLSRKHKRMSVDAVQAMVKKSMKEAGLRPFSPHKLRHTSATLMLQNGVDVRTLQELLGHANLSTTQVYTHVNSDNLRIASRANPISKVKRGNKGS